MIKKSSLLLGLGVFIQGVAHASGSSNPWNSGAAYGYSAFLFGDYQYSYSDTQSSIFVGGNANIHDFSVGSGQPANLEVLGHLDFTSGYINGNLLSDDASLTNVGIAGSQSAPTVSYEQLLGIQNYYSDLSYAWGNQGSAEHITQTSWGELSLDAQSGWNFFDVGAGTDFQVVLNNNFNINLQSDSNVVINFHGDHWNLHNLGFFLNGQQVDEYQDSNSSLAQRLFFNFPDAQNITLGCLGETGSCGGIGIPANLLAPFADITAFNGQLIGGIIADSISDGGLDPVFGRYQINNPQMAYAPHNLPGSPSAPEVPLPPSVWMLLSGLGSFLGFRRKWSAVNLLGVRPVAE